MCRKNEFDTYFPPDKKYRPLHVLWAMG